MLSLFLGIYIVTASPPALAATLTGPVTGWSKGDVPTTVSMYIDVPTNVVTNPPILVVSHECGGSASSLFGWNPGGLVGRPTNMALL